MTESNVRRCACGTELAAALLACPICRRLVHAQRLAVLARSATEREAAGDIRGALAHLREALGLLPSSSRQHAKLHERASRLSDAIDAGGASPAADASAESARRVAAAAGDPGAARLGAGDPAAPPSNLRTLAKAGAAVGGIGLLVWKLKFVVVFVATKGKLLLLGLSKSTTLLSMLLSLGVYWSLWGWPFALGLVLSIYVHEMGHVAAMRRFGIPASAPMFIPGLGAVVRMDAYPQTAREDARIGLAGPVWGLGCAVVVAGVHYATGNPMLAAIASVGAWINLFNLVPIWQLDGGRGLRALSKPGRWMLLALIVACGIAFEEGLYVLIGMACVFRALSKDAPEKSDPRTAWEYAILLVALGLVSKLPVAI